MHLTSAFLTATLLSLCSCGSEPAGVNKDEAEPSAVSKFVANDPAAQQTSGIVKWWSDDRGFGFITTFSGDDVFVELSDLLDTTNLREGQEVYFLVTPTARGLRAQDVTTATDQESPG